MGMSCSCGDFDKSECDHWWEPGRKSVPPAGTKCCECDAPLPAEKHLCIDHWEVYEPDGAPPEDVNRWPGLTDYDAKRLVWTKPKRDLVAELAEKGRVS